MAKIDPEIEAKLKVLQNAMDTEREVKRDARIRIAAQVEVEVRQTEEKTDALIMELLRAGAKPAHIHKFGLRTTSSNRVYEVKKRLELEPKPVLVDSVRMIEYLWAIEHDDLERDVAVFEVDGETVRVHRGETGADPITEEHNDERWNRVLADNHERFVAILREYLNS